MKVNLEAAYGTKNKVQMLKNELNGVACFFHTLKVGEKLQLEVTNNHAGIFILSEGKITLNGHLLEAKGLAAFSDNTQIKIEASEKSQFLELQYDISHSEEINEKLFPYFIDYANAEKYSEDCKSAKTVSRMLLPQRILPQIAIGSVETSGYDKIEKHVHPYVEQLFFGFSENNMQLLIENEKIPMGGNTLAHIPLGSSHGVLAEEGQYVHYVWIDFIIDKRGIDYIDNAHEIIK